MTEDEKLKLFQFYNTWQDVFRSHVDFGNKNFSMAKVDPTFTERIILYLTLENIKLNNSREHYDDVIDYVYQTIEELDHKPEENLTNVFDIFPGVSRVVEKTDNVIKVDFTNKKKS